MPRATLNSHVLKTSLWERVRTTAFLSLGMKSDVRHTPVFMAVTLAMLSVRYELRPKKQLSI
jgi:hypothetical protein